MTDPGELAEFFGFTEEEVKGLCEEYAMNFEEVKAWYDGYDLFHIVVLATKDIQFIARNQW